MDKLLKSVCLFCAIVQSLPSPLTCPPNRTPTPTETMNKASFLQLGLFRMAEQSTLPWHYLPTQHHYLALAQCQSLLLPSATLLGVPRVGLFVPILDPTSPTGPCPMFGHLGVGPLTLAPLQTLLPARATGTVLLRPLYAVILVVTAARAARRPYICLC